LGQINQTFSCIELGYNIYDIRDDFRVPFAWTEHDGRDVWKMFWWNKKELIIPAILVEGLPYNWYISNDGEFLETYTPTTNKSALQCFRDKKTYYG
jgi:hypothetical protein